MSKICLDITTTLFHSLWQAGVLYLAYFIYSALRNNKSPESDRKFSITILISQFFISLFTFVVIHQKDNSFALSLLDSVFQFNSIITPSNSIYIVTTYGFIFLLKQSSSYFRRIVFTKQLVQDMILPTESFLSLVQKHKTTLRFRRQIRFFFHHKINSALTIGFWKPIVIFPIALVNQLSEAETEALILHELHHIKNYDFLFLRLATLIHNLFFFNPFIYLIKKNIEADMELSCDHAVLRKQNDMISYAIAQRHSLSKKINWKP
jgi:Zn-dependent protease with chaperone function